MQLRVQNAQQIPTENPKRWDIEEIRSVLLHPDYIRLSAMRLRVSMEAVEDIMQRMLGEISDLK